MDSTLRIDELVLRKWRDNDTPKLYLLASDPEIAKWAGWIPHMSEDYSKAIIRTVLSAEGEFAITLDDEPIGSIGLRVGRSNNRGIDSEDEGEVGYWIGRNYQNRGYATKALSEVIKHGFKDIGLNAIWCGFFDGNFASQKVIEKNNLKFHHRNENLYNSMRNEFYNETMMRITIEEYIKNMPSPLGKGVC